LLGNSKNNAIINTPIGKYFDTFLKEDPEFYPKILFESFLVKGLNPNTKYTFTVRAKLSSGDESEDSKPLVVTTPPNYKKEKIIVITEKGALGDGKTLNTEAIQKAIDTCVEGSLSPYQCKVKIPRGTFLTGSIMLKSNMTLELAAGAVLLGSPNSKDYPQIERLSMPSALINVIDSLGSKNIRIVGNGIIDANGWKKNTIISDELGNPLPVYVKGSPKTVKQAGVLAANQVSNGGSYGNSRSTMLLLLGITNLHIGGNLTLRNPSMITIAIGNSQNISVVNTRLHTYDANNGDGMNIGSSRNVIIMNNFYETGDDAIAMGTGQGKRSNSDPVECVIIRNNYFRHSHGCSFGGYLGDWVQDVLIEDNIFFLSDNGIRMKATKEVGGGVRRVCIRNIGMKAIGTTNCFQYNNKTLCGNTINGYPLIFTLKYTDGKVSFPAAETSTIFSFININYVSIDGIDTHHASGFLKVDGVLQNMHNNFALTNLKIKNVLQGTVSQLNQSIFDTVQIDNFAGQVPIKFSQCKGLQFINVPAINPQSNYS
uniref:Fibronectin type-III domain-containing protein n=1 Tax=Meloidogyne hapla TaxID=6305 RepID=A0A1I8BJV4_MELHA